MILDLISGHDTINNLRMFFVSIREFRFYLSALRAIYILCNKKRECTLYTKAKKRKKINKGNTKNLKINNFINIFIPILQIIVKYYKRFELQNNKPYGIFESLVT